MCTRHRRSWRRRRPAGTCRAQRRPAATGLCVRDSCRVRRPRVVSTVDDGELEPFRRVVLVEATWRRHQGPGERSEVPGLRPRMGPASSRLTGLPAFSRCADLSPKWDLRVLHSSPTLALRAASGFARCRQEPQWWVGSCPAWAGRRGPAEPCLQRGLWVLCACRGRCPAARRSGDGGASCRVHFAGRKIET